MKINRREFLYLTTILAAGCQSGPEGGAAAVSPRLFNAGPASAFAADGVYDQFHSQGFFIVRRGDKLTILSSVCTHRTCPLQAEPDRTFYCKCHGSTFDPDGHVTEGPARRNLPVFSSSISNDGDLIIQLSYSRYNTF